jgi:hypothetical protein
MTEFSDLTSEVIGTVCQFLPLESVFAVRATRRSWNEEALAHCKTLLRIDGGGSDSVRYAMAFECEGLERAKHVRLDDGNARTWLQQVTAVIMAVDKHALWCYLIDLVVCFSTRFHLYIGTPVLGSPECVRLMEKIDSTKEVVAASLTVAGWNGRFMNFGRKYSRIHLCINPLSQEGIPKLKVEPGTSLSMSVINDYARPTHRPHILPCGMFVYILKRVVCPITPRLQNLVFKGVDISRTFDGLTAQLESLNANSLCLNFCHAGKCTKGRIKACIRELNLQFTPVAAVPPVFVFSDLTFLRIETWVNCPEQEQAFKALIAENPGINTVELATFESEVSALVHLKRHPNLQTLTVDFFMRATGEALNSSFIKLKETCPQLHTLRVNFVDPRTNTPCHSYSLEAY